MDEYEVKLAMLASPNSTYKVPDTNVTVQFVNDMPMSEVTDFKVDITVDRNALVDKIRDMYNFSDHTFRRYVRERLGDDKKFAHLLLDAHIVNSNLLDGTIPLKKFNYCPDILRTDIVEYLYCEYVKTSVNDPRIVSLEIDEDPNKSLTIVAKDVRSISSDVLDIVLPLVSKYLVGLDKVHLVRVLHVPRSALTFVVSSSRHDQVYGRFQMLRYLKDESARNAIAAVRHGIQKYLISVDRIELSRCFAFIHGIDASNEITRIAIDPEDGTPIKLFGHLIVHLMAGDKL